MPTTLRMSLVTLFLLTILICAVAADSPKTAASPLEAIQWLVGDWHAVAKAPDGSVTQIDNHIYWSDTHTAIFFLTKFNGQPHYSGMYAYDPARKQIGFWYVDSEGQFSQGTATPHDMQLVQNFEISKLDGTTSILKSLVQRGPGDASYHWQVFRSDNTSNKPLVELDYIKK